jgi:hypothetical protein
VRNDNNQRSITYRAFVPIVRTDVLLWRAGTPTDHPAAETHILQLPFSFQIPEDAPSSFHASRHNSTATVSYAVEAVAYRPGMSQFKRRVGSVIPVLSTASVTQIRDSARLIAGWNRERMRKEKTQMIRQRFWGEHAAVEAQVNNLIESTHGRKKLC